MVSNAYKPTISGVVTSIDLFRKGLIQAGHSVGVLAPRYAHYEDTEENIFRLTGVDLTGIIDFSLAIPLPSVVDEVIDRFQPDIIHSHHAVWMGEAGAAAAVEKNIPLVFTFHTMYEEYAASFFPPLAWASIPITRSTLNSYFHQCAHVIAPTQSVGNLIKKRYAIPCPVSVISTPIDFARYTQLTPAAVRHELGFEDCELLLYVGRFSAEKNLPLLLQAFSIIAPRRPQARLLIVGGGPMHSELVDLAGQLGISERVMFHEPVPFSRVPHFMAAADVFTFPSSIETQGLVLVEAMAAGTPVVAVKADFSCEILREGGGVTVPGDPASFADAIQSLLENPPSRQALSLEAINYARKYSIKSATLQLCEVYHRVIDAPLGW